MKIYNRKSWLCSYFCFKWATTYHLYKGNYMMWSYIKNVVEDIENSMGEYHYTPISEIDKWRVN